MKPHGRLRGTRSGRVRADDRECCRLGTGKWAGSGGKRADRRGAWAGGDEGMVLRDVRTTEHVDYVDAVIWCFPAFLVRLSPVELKIVFFI